MRKIHDKFLDYGTKNGGQFAICSVTAHFRPVTMKAIGTLPLYVGRLGLILAGLRANLAT